jgi:hypothetical protein
MELSFSASIQEHGRKGPLDGCEMINEQDNASPSGLGFVHELMEATKIN